MVQQGDFTVELVEANSKTPFKEHYKNAKVYVEVEPEAEYFINIKKTGKERRHVSVVKFVVDDTPLDYKLCYQQRELTSSPNYRGLRSVGNGMRTHTALKFEKPCLVGPKEDGRSGSSLMGKVEIKIHEGILRGKKTTRDHMKQAISSEVDSALLHHGNGKKVLRSTEGSETLSKPVSSKSFRSYKRGKEVETITLYYCAAVGLIQAGVLPKPDLYEHHRMVEKFVSTGRGQSRQCQANSIDISSSSSSAQDESKDKPSLKRKFGEN